MYLNKKNLDSLLHRVFILSWGEGRAWHDKRFTETEMRDLETRIKTFSIYETKKELAKE